MPQRQQNIISKKSTTTQENFMMSTISQKRELLLRSLWQKVTGQARGLRLTMIAFWLCMLLHRIELSEDEVLSETGSEVSLSLHTEEVLPYLFEPEWSSSEPDVDLTETPDTADTQEKRIGNTDWH